MRGASRKAAVDQAWLPALRRLQCWFSGPPAPARSQEGSVTTTHRPQVRQAAGGGSCHMEPCIRFNLTMSRIAVSTAMRGIHHAFR